MRFSCTIRQTYQKAVAVTGMVVIDGWIVVAALLVFIALMFAHDAGKSQVVETLEATEQSELGQRQSKRRDQVL